MRHGKRSKLERVNSHVAKPVHDDRSRGSHDRPALPDVVDVTLNGSLSGSGGMATECFHSSQLRGNVTAYPSGCSCLTVTAATNTQVGTAFETSGSAVGTAPGAVGSLDYHGFQEVTATADSLDIALEAGQTPDGVLSWDGTATETISLGFELTEESVIQLDVQPFGPLGTNSGDLPTRRET